MSAFKTLCQEIDSVLFLRASPSFLSLCLFKKFLIFRVCVYSRKKRSRWIGEMEFLKGILSRDYSDSSFCMVSTLVFHSTKCYFMSRHEFSCFLDFFVWIFKTRVGYISVNPPQNKLSKNSIWVLRWNRLRYPFSVVSCVCRREEPGYREYPGTNLSCVCRREEPGYREYPGTTDPVCAEGKNLDIGSILVQTYPVCAEG